MQYVSNGTAYRPTFRVTKDRQLNCRAALGQRVKCEKSRRDFSFIVNQKRSLVHLSESVRVWLQISNSWQSTSTAHSIGISYTRCVNFVFILSS